MRPGPRDAGWVGSLFEESIGMRNREKTRGETLVCHLAKSKFNGGVCHGCDDQHGTPCTYSRPAEHTLPKPTSKLQDCTDCICPHCANNGVSCHDCKGPEECFKHNGKIGLCPDFRAKEGEKGQNCMTNGCLCFTCGRLGECDMCQGPMNCEGPTTACPDYVGAETESEEPAEASP